MSKKPVVLVVMDGVGYSVSHLGDAVSQANTPTLDRLLKEYPNTSLKAHGGAVGLPTDDDMGNSEVGHNALGCGQIYSQGAKLVNESLESGKMFESDTWKSLVSNAVENKSTLHFIGLLSDGNVHSNISHLKIMVKRAKEEGVSRVRIHALLDGRDVPATSGLTYIEDMENTLAKLNDESFDAKIASGGGRMKVTMDRYQADWNMVKLGYDTHVHGIGEQFGSAAEAYTTLREKTGEVDQNLPPFVIAENGEPVGKIVDNDSVILFNFRGDRAIELSMAFDYDDFDKFDRGNAPKVLYAGMLQYDGDLNLPKNYLVNPPEITNTLSEVLVNNNIASYAVSETQKYGHVTYFWNGNKSEKFSDELEVWKEIPSDNVPFDQRPWMKSAEVTDDLIEAMKSGKYQFLRCNYPNGDMVGHTGSMEATIVAVEAVDLGLARLLKAADEYGYTVLITADHGNADEMLEKNKKGDVQVRTAHSLNRVPFIIYDKDTKIAIKDADQQKYGLANVAPTVAALLGVEAPDCWEDSMI